MEFELIYEGLGRYTIYAADGRIRAPLATFFDHSYAYEYFDYLSSRTYGKLPIRENQKKENNGI